MKKLLTISLLVLAIMVSAAQPGSDLKTITGKDEKITAQSETESCWWIGTTNGLYRIKKKNMKVFHYTSQNSSLPSNHITSMCATPDGEVYIGTNKGILRYDRFAFLLITSENSKLTSDHILALQYDADKGIIAETSNHMMCSIK